MAGTDSARTSASLALLASWGVSGAGAPSRDERWNCRHLQRLCLGGRGVGQTGDGCRVDLMEVRVYSRTLVWGPVPPSHPDRLPRRVFEPERWAGRSRMRRGLSGWAFKARGHLFGLRHSY